MSATRAAGSGGCARYAAAGWMSPFSIPNTRVQNASEAAAAPSTAPRRPRPMAPFTMATG